MPKVETPDDVRFLARLLDGLGQERGRPVELHILIESARALARVEDILDAGPEIVSASFGSGDYAFSVGSLDGLVDDGDAPAPARLPFEHGQGRFVTACHAFGVTPLDGPFPRVDDAAGCRHAAGLGRELGFTGKWAIHPARSDRQRDLRPPAEHVEWARRVVAALADAKARQVGAVQVNGRLVEAAHLTVAERILSDETEL